MRLSLYFPALALVAATAFAVEPPPDYRFQAEILAENFPKPLQLDIAPDGRIFLIELRGKLKIYNPVTKQVTEAGQLEVFDQQENGLLGMALSPDFAKTGWIYLLHSPKAPDGESKDGKPVFKGQIISRFTMKGDTLDLSSRVDLLKYAEQREQCCHHAGALEFGPDGCLYASSGDNTNPFDSDGYSPLDERANRSPWDARKSAANTNDLRGKIIRIRPTPEGGYEIPKGNLFPPGTDKTRPEIYAMGFRNPWRFHIDPKTGYIYVGDVGPDSNAAREGRGPSGYDTLNQVRKPGNFGWPLSRGNHAYADYRYETKQAAGVFDPLKPLNISPNNTGLQDLPPIQAPLIWYPYGESKEFPALGSGGRTACGGPVYRYNPKFATTSGFPEYYDGCVIFWDWQRPFIKWIRLDKDSNMTGIEPFTNAVRVGTGQEEASGRISLRRPVDMKFGADGALYVLDYGETWDDNKDSRLVRISYERGNLPPIAKASAKNTEGREPLTVELSADGSKDPEGSALKYQWTLQPSGKVLSTEANPKITITEPGVYKAVLRVTDSAGASGENFAAITVGNTAPVVSFEYPKDGNFFIPGQPVRYKAIIKDVEDGDSASKAAEFDPRTLVSAAKIAPEKKNVDPGFTLMKSSDCFNCHSVNQQLVGPALVDIANKYRGQPAALAQSVQRVLNGSTGVWGQVGMLPHSQHTLDELNIMVRWIYSLESSDIFPTMMRAVEGEILTPADSTGGCTLSVTYTDAGRPPAGSLSTRATVTLRSRRIEGEAGMRNGMGVVDSKNASNKAALGGINHGTSVKYPDVPIRGIKTVTVHASSESEGGIIEFRTGSVDGPKIGEVKITKTGGWDDFQDFTIPLALPAGETVDIFLVFLNPGKGGLMNVDWIQFNP